MSKVELLEDIGKMTKAIDEEIDWYLFSRKVLSKFTKKKEYRLTLARELHEKYK